MKPLSPELIKAHRVGVEKARAVLAAEPWRGDDAFRIGHGAALREIRKGRHQYPVDVAIACGVTRQAVEAWEAGTSRPRPALLQRLAAFWGIPYSQLSMIGLPTVGESDPWLVK